ncbi:concanavalin A-like lectin/glucanase domain-containing protein [Kalaharituber pfeilii]|nr:concanavalin A-like lectin/glucanase domain-containing protein [Kalaharituber pfeilii]
MSLYILSLDKVIPLRHAVQPDGIIIFQSPSVDLRTTDTSTAGTMDCSSLNLLNHSGDILLHISFRRQENAIVFNTRRNGNWESEERVVLTSVTSGRVTNVMVYDHGNRYQILIDGRTAHYFNKRYQEPAMQVHYWRNPPPGLPLSDPIVVMQYQNLGQLFVRDGLQQPIQVQ